MSDLQVDEIAGRLQPGERITVVLNDAGKAQVPDPYSWVITGAYLSYEEVLDYLHLHWEKEDREVSVWSGHIGFLGVVRPAEQVG